jgi:uncharacterized repeat protein (TIGR04076 family)
LAKEGRANGKGSRAGIQNLGHSDRGKGTLQRWSSRGEEFEISCHNPGGLCGFFYHDIFVSLLAFQFGGNLPWWQGDAIQVQCPDSHNLVTVRLERSKRP